VPANAQVRSRVEGEVAIVDLEVFNAAGGFATDLNPDATLVGPDGRADPLTVVQTGPGRWRAEFSASEAGAYLVNFGLGAGEDGRRATMQASVSVPYPKEFRTVRDNRALLEQIAEKTGGRVLSMSSQPTAIDAFLRDNLPVPQSARRMWDLMAILAAVFFLLDVAVRRIAVDWAGARSGVAGAVAVRKVGDGTVEAWKKARSKSGARGGAGTGEGAAPSDSMRDTLERGPGLDVRNAVKEGGTAPAPDAPRAPKGDEPAAGGDEETTSRLLRAKRRATGDGGGDAADGKGGGGGG
jgi:hypothetical protein